MRENISLKYPLKECSSFFNPPIAEYLLNVFYLLPIVNCLCLIKKKKQRRISTSWNCLCTGWPWENIQTANVKNLYIFFLYGLIILFRELISLETEASCSHFEKLWCSSCFLSPGLCLHNIPNLIIELTHFSGIAEASESPIY